MIDLEESLAQLVDGAPEVPELATVERRGRQRRRNRRGFAIATTLVVLIAGVGVANAVVSARRTPHVAGVVPKVQHLRVTLLDGSQLEISGPQSLGLTTLAPAFNGSLGPVSDPQWGTLGHGFSVGHTPPSDLGAVVDRYPTHDGHELVVHATPFGVDAVVQYGNWWLDASWAKTPPAQWTAFASELNARETADGFLVIEPTDTSWKVGPADAPDAQLGGAAYGSGADFGFFGPKTYPAGCPNATGSGTHTTQGWPVSLENGAWWCDADAKVRVAAWNPKSAGAAIAGLRVSFTSAADEVANVTTLDGSKFEITAPSSVLDHFITQATVAVDGLRTRTPIVINAERTDAARHEGDAPHRVPGSTFTSGDGHRLFVARYPLGDEVLQGTYGDWTVHVTVTDATDADRARVASLLAAHETADGFLVLDPKAPMHFVSGPASDIVLNGVDIVELHGRVCSTADQNPGARCDPQAGVEILGHLLANPLVNHVHVRRVG